LVCGLVNEHIQRKLLVEADLTYDRAKAIAIAAETAVKDAVELRHQPAAAAAADVNKLKYTAPKPTSSQQCTRCGKRNHSSSECYFRDKVCHNCAKKGHTKRMCKTKSKPQKSDKKKSMNFVGERETDSENDSDDTVGLMLNYVQTVKVQPFVVTVMINNVDVNMEIDSGSPVSLMPYVSFKKYFGMQCLQPADVRLSTFTGESLNVRGYFPATVVYEGQTHQLKLYIVDGGSAVLLGRSWLEKIKLNWQNIREIHSLQSNRYTLSELKAKYADLFDGKLGKMTSYEAKLHLKENSVPVFMRARSIPYAMRHKVEQELHRLEEEGVLTKTSSSDWATPIVPILKKNGQVRICGDYKTTVNPALKVDHYPLPKPQDIFASLAGGKQFTKIDLRQAYLQCPVDEATGDILTWNTHKGLYRVNRLAFGISSAPSLWQQKMDQILQGIPFCHCILDDILVTGRDDDEHLRILDQVFEALHANGLRLNIEKCSFMQDSLEYCGHVITRNGIQQSPSKTEAILNAPVPENVSQLRSLLGLITYYRSHLPGISDILHPLNELLKQEKKWCWSLECDRAFKTVKQLIAADTCLTHFDATAPITLATDASGYGIGCVLSHRTSDGERPICFASRSLTKPEKNYSQLDREGLSIVWAVKKMSDYIYGRHFTLVTDNRPIAAILSPNKATPPMVAARLQRWSSFLSGYDYTIEQRSTHKHANADFLSRFPLPIRQKPKEVTVSAIDGFFEEQFEALPVTASMIRRHTRTDTELSQVFEFVQTGWPTMVPPNLQPYFCRRQELSTNQGCVIWGTRVVIPQALRPQILSELHAGHLGIVRMKTLARSYVWWPKLDSQLEETARQCQACLQTRNMPSSTIHQWERPTGPWQRVHVDFLGPVYGHMLLVAVCAYSKWPEVVVMKEGTTAAQTIEALQKIFAAWGLPTHLHSDNGVQFVSKEFQQFVKTNGIHHTTSAIYHPNSNGQAERFVAIVKRALKAMKSDGTSLETKIARFLITYRTSVNSSTGEIPSVLMTGRRLRTRLDLVRPMKQNYMPKQNQSERHFVIGDTVAVRDYRAKKNKWLPGIISQKHGHLMYSVLVTTPSGTVTFKRHVDQIIPRDTSASDTSNNDLTMDQEIPNIPVVMDPAPINQPTTPPTPTAAVEPTTTPPPEANQETAGTSQQTVPRPAEHLRTFSGRRVVTPAKLKDYVH